MFTNYKSNTNYLFLSDEDKQHNIFQHLTTGVKYIDISEKLVGVNKGKVVSLFTGAGGLDIGLEAAGFETAVCVEINPDCRETLRYNRPGWKIFEDGTKRIPGDIRAIKTGELLDFGHISRGELSLVVGGAPCQPFSNIGKKRGKNDPINGDLFLEFVRIVKGLLPKAFIFENVSGITHAKHADVINYMRSKFEELGYGVSCTILNAADYGVAQKRERFFLLGLSGIENPAFPLPTHYKNREAWKQFTYNFDKIPETTPQKWRTLGDVLHSIPKNASKRNDYILMNISDVVQNRMKHIKPGQNFKALPMKLRPECWKSGKHQGHDTFGRPKLDEPSVTIRTSAYNPSKGKYIHPTENRGLSSIEMAAIQSFPKDWIFKYASGKNITLVSVGKQIGNAVPPLLAKAIGQAIMAQLEEIS